MDEDMTRMKLRENDKGAALGADVGIRFRRKGRKGAANLLGVRREGVADAGEEGGRGLERRIPNPGLFRGFCLSASHLAAAVLFVRHFLS